MVMPIKPNNNTDYTLNPSKTRWVRVYTLEDGSKWTVAQLQKELESIHKCKFTLSTARGRLINYTEPHEVFKRLRKHTKSHLNKGRRIFKQSNDERKEKKLMHLALKSIGGKQCTT
jgi:hypothetical protein